MAEKKTFKFITVKTIGPGTMIDIEVEIEAYTQEEAKKIFFDSRHTQKESKEKP